MSACSRPRGSPENPWADRWAVPTAAGGTLALGLWVFPSLNPAPEAWGGGEEKQRK